MFIIIFCCYFYFIVIVIYYCYYCYCYYVYQTICSTTILIIVRIVLPMGKEISTIIVATFSTTKNFLKMNLEIWECLLHF